VLLIKGNKLNLIILRNRQDNKYHQVMILNKKILVNSKKVNKNLLAKIITMIGRNAYLIHQMKEVINDDNQLFNNIF